MKLGVVIPYYEWYGMSKARAIRLLKQNTASSNCWALLEGKSHNAFFSFCTRWYTRSVRTLWRMAPSRPEDTISIAQTSRQVNKTGFVVSYMDQPSASDTIHIDSMKYTDVIPIAGAYNHHDPEDTEIDWGREWKTEVSIFYWIRIGWKAYSSPLSQFFNWPSVMSNWDWYFCPALSAARFQSGSTPVGAEREKSMVQTWYRWSGGIICDVRDDTEDSEQNNTDPKNNNNRCSPTGGRRQTHIKLHNCLDGFGKE